MWPGLKIEKGALMIYVMYKNMPLPQGRIQDFGKGGSGKMLSTKTPRFCVQMRDVFSLCMKLRGPPKGGGGDSPKRGGVS